MSQSRKIKRRFQKQAVINEVGSWRQFKKFMKSLGETETPTLNDVKGFITLYPAEPSPSPEEAINKEVATDANEEDNQK